MCVKKKKPVARKNAKGWGRAHQGHGRSSLWEGLFGASPVCLRKGREGVWGTERPLLGVLVDTGWKRKKAERSTGDKGDSILLTAGWGGTGMTAEQLERPHYYLEKKKYIRG